MPYITEEQRQDLDPFIYPLVSKITLLHYASDDPANFAYLGMLNYVCQEIILQVVRKCTAKLRYWVLAMLEGLFGTMSKELYRRLGAYYENKAISKNGDIPSYNAILESLREKK